MDLFEAFGTCFRKYAVFSGRARRSEYWLFCLANILLAIVLSLLTLVLTKVSQTAVMVAYGLSCLFSLVMFLPGLAVMVRRLHDTDHSGAAVLLLFVPLVGPIILLVWYCRDGTPGPNRYGESPKLPPERPKTPEPPAAEEPGSGAAVSLVKPPAAEPGDKTQPLTPPPPQPRLLVDCVEGGDKGAHAEGKLVYVGRDAALCQLVLQHSPSVSRSHCMIHLNEGRIELMDLNSRNGTYLADGTRLPPNQTVVIANGSKLLLGSRDTAVFIGVAQ